MLLNRVLCCCFLLFKLNIIRLLRLLSSYYCVKIFYSESTGENQKENQSLCVFTWLNVLGEDLDVLVSVRANLLVVEAQSVENLVLHRGLVQTAISPQGHTLTSALTAQVRPTP